MTPGAIEQRIADLVAFAATSRSRGPRGSLTDEETANAVDLGLDLLKGFLVNVARIADALESIAGPK